MIAMMYQYPQLYGDVSTISGALPAVAVGSSQPCDARWKSSDV
jgi:hypothetical protein